MAMPEKVKPGAATDSVPKTYGAGACSVSSTANGQSAVYVLREGKAERRAVRTGMTRGANIEIMAGVNQGELVITKGPDDLHDGQEVNRKQ